MIGYFDSDIENDATRPAELIPNKLNHKHIVKYYESSFQYIESNLFHVIGQLYNHDESWICCF